MAVLSDSTPALDRWSEPVELREAIHGLRASLATLSHRLDTGQGTLGRLLHDEELIVQIRVLRQGLREMMAAIQEDPMGSVNIELY
jgi:hypothetical protein